MEKNETQEEHMIKEENICHMYCIEKTRRRTKNENEVNILRQIYLVGEKKNREAKGEEERRKKRRKICFSGGGEEQRRKWRTIFGVG